MATGVRFLDSLPVYREDPAFREMIYDLWGRLRRRPTVDDIARLPPQQLQQMLHRLPPQTLHILKEIMQGHIPIPEPNVHELPRVSETPDRLPPYLVTDEIRRLYLHRRQQKNARAWQDLALFTLMLEWAIPLWRLLSLQRGQVKFTQDAAFLVFRIGIGPAEMLLHLRISHFPLAMHFRTTPMSAPQLFPLKPAGVRSLFRRWSHQAGLTRRLTAALLLNTAVLTCLARGVPVNTLQLLWGGTLSRGLSRRIAQARTWLRERQPLPLLPLEGPQGLNWVSPDEV